MQTLISNVIDAKNMCTGLFAFREFASITFVRVYSTCALLPADHKCYLYDKFLLLENKHNICCLI